MDAGKQRKPTFLWQGMMILLPVAVLAVACLIALRQDRAAVEREARERASELVENLAGELSTQAGVRLAWEHLQVAYHQKFLLLAAQWRVAQDPNLFFPQLEDGPGMMRGMTPLQYAVSKGHTEMVKFLISKGAEVDAKDLEGMTALICAAVHGYTEVINTLLSAGAKPDIEDKRGHTALLYVAALGNIDSVKLLLAAKANPNADKAGGLLCWAGPLRHPGCVKLLLEAGAKPDIKQNDGQTPLLTAIERGYYDSAVLLIQHGADLNLANDKQMTPLMMAVWTESPSMVSLLLTNGANVNVRGPAGRTALAMAKDAESGIRPAPPGVYSGVGIVPNKAIDHQIVEILLQHGTSSEPSKK